MIAKQSGIRSGTAMGLVLAFSCGLGAQSALAQDALTPEGQTLAQSPLEDTDDGAIVVTARRVSEDITDVPASIDVITAEVLETTGAKVAADFVQLTSGVTIVSGNVEAGDTQINIRGLNGARDAENNVALVVDGVLKTNTSSLSQDQGAVTQIEVLKGTQGALYGRNAAAGAIVISTKKPGDFWEGDVKASYANDKTWDAAAFIAGPVGDNLGIVINGDYGRSDGFFRNAFAGTPQALSLYGDTADDPKTIDDYERWNINGRAVLEAGPDTEFDLKLRYGELTSGAISFNAAFQLPVLADLFGAPVFNIDVNDHRFIFTPNIDAKNRQKTFEGSLRFEHGLGIADLVGFVAYNEIKNFFYADGTSGTFGFFNNEPNCIQSGNALRGFPVQAPFGIDPGNGAVFLPPYSPTTCDGTQFQQRNQRDYSAELRLVGDNGPIRWQLGAYYLNIKRDVCLNLGLDTGNGVVEACYTTDPTNPTEALADDTFKTDVYAGFGSVDLDLGDRLTIGAALRYDIEERSVSNNVPTDARTRWVGNVLTGFPNGTVDTPANYYLNPGLDPAYNPSGVLPDRSNTYKQLQPKVTLAFEATDNLNLFANWGIGFKSGGFNNSGSQAVVDGFFNTIFNAGITIFDDYDKEKSSSFEVGFKYASDNSRVRLDAAAYYTDVTDMQFFEFFVGPFGLLRVVSNIDKVRLKGFEGSANFEVVEGWDIFASGNYTDSEIRANSARPYTVGNKSPYTAEYTVNLGTQVRAPIAPTFDLVVRGDYRITGPTWFHTVQDNTVPNVFGLPGNFRNSQRDAFGILNVRAGLYADRWSIAAYANNALNKDYLSEVIPAPEFGGDFLSAGADARYGIEIGYKF